MEWSSPPPSCSGRRRGGGRPRRRAGTRRPSPAVPPLHRPASKSSHSNSHQCLPALPHRAGHGWCGINHLWRGAAEPAARPATEMGRRGRARGAGGGAGRPAARGEGEAAGRELRRHGHSTDTDKRCLPVAVVAVVEHRRIAGPHGPTSQRPSPVVGPTNSISSPIFVACDTERTLLITLRQKKNGVTLDIST